MQKFLIITQVFSPDPAAVGQYFDEAAQAIAANGAEVTVLTANRGYDKPEQRFVSHEERNGIRIRRLPFSSFGKASLPIRIAAQLSFLLQSTVRGLFSSKTTDILISTSPPMAGIAAVMIHALRPKLRIHYWLMDLNPDQAVEMGVYSKDHIFVKAMDWLNRRLLKRADNIIALDRFMAASLKAKRPDLTTAPASTEPKSLSSHASSFVPQNGDHTTRATQLHLIPPWPMEDYLAPVAHEDNLIRKSEGWDDKFVVMYSGNHSPVHPLDTLLDAAEALQDDPRFVFAFIGGGKGKEAVEARIQKLEANHKTSSIVSTGYKTIEMIRYSLSAADLHVVSLGDNMSGIVHPCKIYNALSIGRPLLTLGPKESYLKDILKVDLESQEAEEKRPSREADHNRRHELLEAQAKTIEVRTQESGERSSASATEVIDGNGCDLEAPFSENKSIGWAIAHGDVEACIAALKEAVNMPQKEHEAMGLRAHLLAEKHFGRQRLLQQFLNAIM